MRGQGETRGSVRELEHTADVGIEVRASDLPELFRRAAIGTMALVQGEEHGSAEGASVRPEGSRSVEIDVPRDEVSASEAPWDSDPAGFPVLDGVDLLLARWLAEILYLLEVERFEVQDAAFSILEPRRLKAVVQGLEEAPEGVREIKGVTYHGLEVSPDGDGWRARVIFDL